MPTTITNLQIPLSKISDLKDIRLVTVGKELHYISALFVYLTKSTV